ncbi:hypothetical protein BUY35_00095 [Staphylococcus cohnii]|nr:hypothetical protein BUY35_00095 [Staphylococcus cohnii]
MEVQTKYMNFVELMKFVWTMGIRDEYYTTLDGDETVHINDRCQLEAQNITIAEDDCFVVEDSVRMFESYKKRSGK